MILTYRQDDILLIKLPLKLPLIRFFLSYWETDGLSTNLILINVVSTISNLHQPILYKTTYRRELKLTKAILTFITWQPAIAHNNNCIKALFGANKEGSKWKYCFEKII